MDLVDRTVGVMSNILAFTPSPVQFYVLMDEQSPLGKAECALLLMGRAGGGLGSF